VQRSPAPRSTPLHPAPPQQPTCATDEDQEPSEAPSDASSPLASLTVTLIAPLSSSTGPEPAASWRTALTAALAAAGSPTAAAGATRT
jgi:hypothetical protein